MLAAGVALAAPARGNDANGLSPTAHYAGGWVGGRQQLYLMMAADDPGEHIDLTGHVEASCGAGTITGAAIPVPASGLAAEGTTRDGAVTTHWRIQGHFDIDGGAGMLDADLAVRSHGRTRRCAVRGRPWAVEWGSSDHQIAPAPPGGTTWHGPLGNTGAFNLLLSPAGDKVAIATFAMDMAFCPGRRGRWLYGVVRDLPLDQDHAFNGKRRFTVIEGAIRRRVEVVIYGFFFRDGVDPAVGVREIATRRRTGRRVWACQTQVVHGYARKARG